MQTAIAFIRGINVGGKNSLPMATLREICESLGWRDVATYIQSGNVAFRCQDRALAKAPKQLEDAIEAKLKFRPVIVVRSMEQMQSVLKAKPFQDIKQPDPSKLLVMFLATKPAAAAKQAVAALKPDPERVALVGSEVFLYYPIGIGASKFQFTKVELAVEVPGTTRNWNTVMKMVEMAQQSAGGSA